MAADKQLAASHKEAVRVCERKRKIGREREERQWRNSGERETRESGRRAASGSYKSNGLRASKGTGGTGGGYFISGDVICEIITAFNILLAYFHPWPWIKVMVGV